jgi:hypothetical protein
MIDTILFISLIPILLSYLSSLRAFRLDMPVIFKRFSFFLLFVLFGESFAIAWPRWIYMHTQMTSYNAWFYNFFHFFCYLFYLYFFYSVLSFPGIKRVIKALALLYVFFVAINLAVGQGVLKINSYTELLNTFMMVFLSITYYFQVLKTKEIIVIKHDIVFWISTGVLIYHLGSMLLLFLIEVVNTSLAANAWRLFIIVELSSMIMYLCFTIGFLWAKKK